MKFIFYTTNQEKIAEAQVILAPYGYEVEGRPYPFIEPTTGSMEEIAVIKLSQINEDENLPIMVDDSGIFLEAYSGFPGILTKRIFSMIGYKGIEKLLVDENRRAFFKGVIAIKWRNEMKVFKGETYGSILRNIPTGLSMNLPFPFDPIFIPDGETKVLADMTIEKRISYSYRKKALEKLENWLVTQHS